MTSTSRFHQINLDDYVTNSNLTVSLHFDVRGVNVNLHYLMIYLFDSETEVAEEWKVLCPTSRTAEGSTVWQHRD